MDLRSEKTQSIRWVNRVAVMAVIAATGVGVIYVPQPIQPLLSEDFQLDPNEASASSVAIQAGYALGVFFLVALGDRFPARYQVSLQLLVTSVALLSSALADTHAIVLVAFFLAGASATVGQILVASALRLSPPERRSQTAATIVGAIVVGLFTVRTVMGALAEAVGWRGAVALVAVLVATLIPASWVFLPGDRRESTPSYRAILASIPEVYRASRPLRLMSIVHTLTFSGFMAMWSLSALHAVNDLGVSVSFASLLSVAGIAGGILTAAVAGRRTVLSPERMLAVALSAAGGGAIASIMVNGSFWLLGLSLFALSFGMSSQQVVTQAVALRSVGSDRSGRANTVYVGFTFLGSSVVTALAATSYVAFGFESVALVACCLVGSAALVALRAHRNGHFSSH